MNLNDLRVIKTKKNIKESFLRLLYKKEFSSIAVQDILDTALINRSTFYKHYSDKYALAEELCQNAFSLFAEDVQKRFECDSTKDAFVVVGHLYSSQSKRRMEFLALFKIHTDTIHLYDDMFAFLKNRFQKEKNGEEDYLSTLYASIVMTTIKWCLEHDGYETLQSHAADFSTLAELFRL